MKKLLILVFLMGMLLIPVVAARRNVDATFLNQNPDPVEPGEYVELRWRFENTGDEDILNISAEIEPRAHFWHI